jgi:hypothetical protein
MTYIPKYTILRVDVRTSFFLPPCPRPSVACHRGKLGKKMFLRHRSQPQMPGTEEGHLETRQRKTCGFFPTYSHEPWRCRRSAYPPEFSVFRFSRKKIDLGALILLLLLFLNKARVSYLESLPPYGLWVCAVCLLAPLFFLSNGALTNNITYTYYSARTYHNIY